MTKYRLEMNEAQARTVISALDFLMRMRIGQWDELADLCMDCDYQDEDDFSAYRNKRDELSKRLFQARQIAMPDCPRGGSFGVYKFEGTERAFNVLKAVRSCIAWHENPKGGYEVIYDRPHAINVTEEMPRCEVVEDAGQG